MIKTAANFLHKLFSSYVSESYFSFLFGKMSVRANYVYEKNVENVENVETFIIRQSSYVLKNIRIDDQEVTK